jgi:hypothetical protein
MTGTEPSAELRKELVAWVRQEIGPIAAPDVIQFALDYRRPDPEKSCGEFCAGSRRMNLARWVIRRHWPIRLWSMI